MYRWFLVYKYVFSRLITLAALLAVTLSVAVLIIVVTVLEGFRSELEVRIRGSTSDVKVESTMFIGLRSYTRVADLVRAVPGVEDVEPFVEAFALYQRSGERAVDSTAEDCLVVARDFNDPHTVQELDASIARVDKPSLDGVPEWFDRFANVLFESLPKDLKGLTSPAWRDEGLWKFPQGRRPRTETPLPGVIVGVENFRRFLLPSHTIKLVSFLPDSSEPVEQEFVVLGYFKTGFYEQDSLTFVISLDDAADVFRLRQEGSEPRVSGLRVTVAPDARGEVELAALRDAIAAKLNAEKVFFTRVQTWREARAPLLRAVRVEKVIVSIILGAVVLFAGFIIFIMLTVQVIEKTRDIAVLQSLGSTPGGIALVYFAIGCSICFGGLILGTAYGTGVALGINTLQRWIEILTGYVLFPDNIYYLDHIPVRFRIDDLLFIILTTVVASLVASVVPAIRCARRRPTEGLRYE